MRYLQLMCVLMLPAVFVGSVYAGDEVATDAVSEKGDRPGRGEFRQKMLEKFDADRDGKLSDDERATAREAMRGRRGGKGGKGPPNPEQLFEKFDADADGQLSREEFMELAKSMRAHHERHGRGKGRAGKGSDRRGGPPELQNPGDRSGPPPRGKGGRRGKGPKGHGQRPPNPEKVFDRFDENGDGQLSRGEFMELSRAMRERHGKGKGRMGKGRDSQKGRPGSEGRDRPRSSGSDLEEGVGPESSDTEDDSV